MKLRQKIHGRGVKKFSQFSIEKQNFYSSYHCFLMLYFVKLQGDQIGLCLILPYLRGVSNKISHKYLDFLKISLEKSLSCSKGREGQANWDYVSKYASFLYGFPLGTPKKKKRQKEWHLAKREGGGWVWILLLSFFERMTNLEGRGGQ